MTERTKLLPAAHLRRIFYVTGGQLYWNINRDTLGIVKGDPVAVQPDPEGYITCRVFDRRVMVHVLIWAIIHGDDLPEHIDHIDQDKTNNHPDNLRAATQQQNQANRGGWSEGKKGVYKSGSKFRAMISEDGTTRHIGTYPTEEAAALAYDAEARRVFGEFAYTNYENDDDT